MKVALVMPSQRGPKSLESFIEIAPPYVDFIILSQEKLEKKHERLVEFNDKEVFNKSWIFNRLSKRNFGFLYAYKQNYDIIITLDDDCFPISNTYFHEHISKLSSYDTQFFNVLEAFENIPEDIKKYGARGYPTIENKKFPIVINQGLWHGDLDLPAFTFDKILNSKDGKVPSPLSKEAVVAKNFIIPKGKFSTVCGMNISFLREVVPAFPWTYQDPDGYGINRYDDIWSGLFIKKIIDKFERRMTVGFPVIIHDKGKREIQQDIDYENKGSKMNNFLWEHLPNLVLEGKDYTTCFLEIADWLSKVSDAHEKFFFKKVSESMYEWIKLLDSKF